MPPPRRRGQSGRLPPRQRARLSAAVHRGFREAAAPGVIVGVQTPRGKWVTAIGIANQRSNAPMKASMHQRIGSVTKTFMGTLLMQLAGEHKLSLGDKVSKYIKGVPNGDTMTLRQVADMTSGVASYTADPAFMKALYSHPERRWRPGELLAIGLRDSPVFAPGTAFQYSDSNYILLGLVIQQVEGRPLGAVLRKRIINPLKLSQTSWPGASAALPKPHAQGYTLQGQSSDKPANATKWNPSYAWAAGEMISSVSNLLVYGRALGTGKGLLRPNAAAGAAAFVPPQNPAGDRDALVRHRAGQRQGVDRTHGTGAGLHHRRLLPTRHRHDGRRGSEQRHRQRLVPSSANPDRRPHHEAVRDSR